MKRMRRWFWSLMVLSMGVAMGAQAETLALYTFTGESAAPATANAFIDASNLSFSGGNVLFGTFSGFPNPPYAQGNGGWGESEQSSANYFEITLDEQFGATFTVTNISFRHRATGAGPSAIALTVNGTTFLTDDVAESDTVFEEVVITGVEDQESVVIQILGWDNGSRSTGGGGQFRVDDILIQGTVDEPAGDFPPSISQPNWSDRTDTTITLSANITATGGPDVDERGFVFSTTSGFDPTIPAERDVVFEDDGGYGTGVFSLPVTGLDPGTVYYFMGYAINSEDITYTSEASFETLAPPPPNALVYYTFTDNSVEPEVVALDVDASNFQVSANTIAFGSAHSGDWEALGADMPYAESANNWDEPARQDAKNFFFELTPEAGQALTITNISYIHRRTPAGPQNVGVLINGASVHSQALDQDDTELVSIAVAGQMNLTNAVIRLDGWNASGTGSYRVDNVLVQGFVDDVVVANDPPEVSTPTVTDIVGGSATLGGTIDDEGDAIVIERGIFWSEIEGFDVGTQGTKVGESGAFGLGAFTIAVSDMPPVTEIYFRAFARNAAGYGLSDEDSFTTGTTAPVVDSPSVANVMSTSATLGGTLVATGGEQVVDIGVIYSDDPDFDPDTEGVTVTDTGDFAPGPYTFEVSGLDPSTEYTFVFFAVNLTGTTYSDKETFTTMAPPPADLLAYYTFDGDSVDATFWDPEITASELTVSDGTITFGWVGTHAAAWEAEGAAEPYAQSSGGWGEEDREDAKYYEIVLDAETEMTITNISFLHRRTGAGPDTTGVRINGTDVFESALVDDEVVPVSIPVSGFEDIGSAAIRLEGWGETSGAGSYRIDNILVQGTIGAGPPATDPDFIEVEFFGGAFSLTFGSKVGFEYQLEYTTDLTADPIDWTPVGGFDGSGTGVGDELTLGDEEPEDPMRIYRVIETPPD